MHGGGKDAWVNDDGWKRWRRACMVDVCMQRQTVGGGWMDEWMDGWMKGWMDG